MSRRDRDVDYGHDDDETSPAAAFLGTDDNPKIRLDAALDAMWAHETEKIKHLHVTSDQDFKTVVDLPLARIKRIMKSDEDVRMISAEAPVLFAKACELFIMEMTMRAWQFPREDKPAGGSGSGASGGHHHHSTRPGSYRGGSSAGADMPKRLLTKESVLDAIRFTDNLDFLVPIMLPAGTRPSYMLPPTEKAKLANAAANPMSQQALALQSTFNYHAPAAPTASFSAAGGAGSSSSSSSSGGGGGRKKGGAAAAAAAAASASSSSTSSGMSSADYYREAAQLAAGTEAELPLPEGGAGMAVDGGEGEEEAVLGRGGRSRSKAGAKKR